MTIEQHIASCISKLTPASSLDFAGCVVKKTSDGDIEITTPNLTLIFETDLAPAVLFDELHAYILRELKYYPAHEHINSSHLYFILSTNHPPSNIRTLQHEARILNDITKSRSYATLNKILLLQLTNLHNPH
jgi:hypothetical protein